MSDTKRACVQCEFWCVNDARAESGICHRFPSGHHTGRDYWCGEFRQSVLGEYQELLLKPMDELELSARVSGAMTNDCIYTVGALLERSHGELLRIPNFGKKSMEELICVMKSLGVEMTHGRWSVQEKKQPRP